MRCSANLLQRDMTLSRLSVALLGRFLPRLRPPRKSAAFFLAGYGDSIANFGPLLGGDGACLEYVSADTRQILDEAVQVPRKRREAVMRLEAFLVHIERTVDFEL